jgi:hypothetical protein
MPWAFFVHIPSEVLPESTRVPTPHTRPYPSRSRCGGWRVRGGHVILTVTNDAAGCRTRLPSARQRGASRGWNRSDPTAAAEQGWCHRRRGPRARCRSDKTEILGPRLGGAMFRRAADTQGYEAFNETDSVGAGDFTPGGERRPDTQRSCGTSTFQPAQGQRSHGRSGLPRSDWLPTHPSIMPRHLLIQASV